MDRQMRETRMTIREQAAWWFAELQDRPLGAQARFSAWLKASPRHVEEFLFFDALWRELDGIDSERRIDLEALVAQAKAAHASATVIPLEQSSGPSAGPSAGHPRLRLLVAAAVVLLAIPFGWLSIAFFSNDADVYSTAVGEQRAIKLADGSFAHLNTHSRIKVEYSEHGRDVRLLEGEALFSVHRDSARPFRVRAGEVIVQALGTEFSVYRHKEATTVSVVEGAVRILDNSAGISGRSGDVVSSAVSAGDRKATLRVNAGEQVDVVPKTGIVKRPAPDLDRALAWRAQRLIFRSEPLKEVAAEFNRYNDIKIRVEGDAIRARRLIGTFDSDDPQSLVQFLAQEGDVAIEKRASEIVIRGRLR